MGKVKVKKMKIKDQMGKIKLEIIMAKKYTVNTLPVLIVV